MKKLFVIAVLAAAPSLVGVGEVTAAGPFYIYFQDYCDCITFQSSNQGGQKWLHGTWDWQCNGAARTLIHGVKSGDFFLGTRPVDSSGVPAGFSATFVFEGPIAPGTGGGHADIAATFDGNTNVLVVAATDYFVRSSPVCPGLPSTKPPLFTP